VKSSATRPIPRRKNLPLDRNQQKGAFQLNGVPLFIYHLFLGFFHKPGDEEKLTERLNPATGLLNNPKRFGKLPVSECEDAKRSNASNWAKTKQRQERQSG
jgi:hypothetical protein